MEGLSLFLDKFRALKPLNQDLEQVLLASILRHTGQTLPRSALKISRQGVYLQASPALKGLIFLHREKIEADILAVLNHERKVVG